MATETQIYFTLLCLANSRPKGRKSAMRWIEGIKQYTNYAASMDPNKFECPADLRIGLWAGIEHYRRIMETAAPTLQEKILIVAESGPITLKDVYTAMPEYALQTLRMTLCAMKAAGLLERTHQGVYAIPRKP